MDSMSSRLKELQKEEVKELLQLHSRSIKQIARFMGLSVATIEKYKREIDEDNRRDNS